MRKQNLKIFEPIKKMDNRTGEFNVKWTLQPNEYHKELLEMSENNKKKSKENTNTLQKQKTSIEVLAIQHKELKESFKKSLRHRLESMTGNALKNTMLSLRSRLIYIYGEKKIADEFYQNLLVGKNWCENIDKDNKFLYGENTCNDTRRDLMNTMNMGNMHKEKAQNDVNNELGIKITNIHKSEFEKTYGL